MPFYSQCSVAPPHGAIGKSAMCVIVVNSGHTHLFFSCFGLIVLFCSHHSGLLFNIASLYHCFQAYNCKKYIVYLPVVVTFVGYKTM